MESVLLAFCELKAKQWAEGAAAEGPWAVLQPLGWEG